MNKFTFIKMDELSKSAEDGIFLDGNVRGTDFSISQSLGNPVPYWTRDIYCFKTQDKEYWRAYVDKHPDSKAGMDFGLEWMDEEDFGVRPVLRFSSLSSIPTNGKPPRRGKDGLLKVEYGYYPQSFVCKTTQKKIADDLQKGNLKKTGNKYTTKVGGHDKKFIEYESSTGERLVKVKVRGNHIFVRQGTGSCSNGENILVRVEPIKWIIDDKNNFMITDKVIFSGIPYHSKVVNQVSLNFEDTNIYKFMNNYWAKEIEQNIRDDYKVLGETKLFESVQDNEMPMQPRARSRLETMNPDNTKPAKRRKMTDTELIQSWIENGESVLLRGPSGIGKTDRIRKMYPNLIELKLTNNMLPEKVVGSTNIQTGEEIPPSYAKETIMQVATEEEKKAIEENVQYIYKVADDIYNRTNESDEKQVILLDELLNVNQHVQSLVYTLVLNRFVEVGKGIKLPKNVVIVATGNQQKYSSTAYSLAEPLEKRFDHILDMEPKVGEWLTGYAIPNQVHPAVTGYIMSKYINKGRSERKEDIKYFYEEPEVGEEHLDKYGQKGRTNDPRGWTDISRGLYEFENDLKKGEYIGINVEDKLRRNLETKLREEWAKEFYDFYNLPTLTPEEVAEEKYTQADLPGNINEKFAYMTALVSANEEQVEKCRNFVRRYCDPEYLSVYDMYWAGDDERRMEKLAELQAKDKETNGRGKRLTAKKSNTIAQILQAQECTDQLDEQLAKYESKEINTL